MKVLLLCLAFAAVSLAMPVAEEKPDVGAPPPPNAVKAEEPAQRDASVVTVEEKQPEAATEPKEADKPAEVKKEAVENQPIKEPEAPKAEESTGSKTDEIVLESKSSEAGPAPQPEQPKPEVSQPEEAKQEEKSANTEAKPVEEQKPVEIAAIVNEVPKDVSAKSAVPEPAIDIVNAINDESAIAKDVVQPDELIPTPEKKIDLPVIPGVDAEAPKENKDEAPAPVQESAKPEEKKPEDPKAEGKTAEISADAAPVLAPAATKSEEPGASSDDSLRVVRGTIADMKDAEATEAPKDDAKSIETAKVEKEETPKEIAEEKKEETPKEIAEQKKEEAPKEIAEQKKEEAPKEIAEQKKEEPSEGASEVLKVSDTIPAPKAPIEATPQASESKPAALPQTDGAAQQSSEEINESGQNNNKDSSEESSEEKN